MITLNPAGQISMQMPPIFFSFIFFIYLFWKKIEERSPHIYLVYFPIFNSICMKKIWLQNILPTLNRIEYVIIFMCGRKKYEYPWIIKIKIIKLFTKQLKRCIKYKKIWLFITSRVFLEPPLNYNNNIILNVGYNLPKKLEKLNWL